MKLQNLFRISALMAFVWCLPSHAANEEFKKDPETGLVIAENWELLKTNCMLCHSTKGFTQVRLDRQNWEKIIRLMQEKNGLWQLGVLEPKILDYLEKHYGLSEEIYNPKIRRPLLD